MYMSPVLENHETETEAASAKHPDQAMRSKLLAWFGPRPGGDLQVNLPKQHHTDGIRPPRQQPHQYVAHNRALADNAHAAEQLSQSLKFHFPPSSSPEVEACCATAIRQCLQQQTALATSTHAHHTHIATGPALTMSAKLCASSSLPVPRLTLHAACKSCSFIAVQATGQEEASSA